MFELFITLKYLLPKKRSLSTSLISCLSTVVISLVVWLVLIFLSVTTGIENRWVEKLTSLNAPLRLSPSHKSPQPLQQEDIDKTYEVLADLQKTLPDLKYQDFEISGALLKLFLQRKDSEGEKLSYLSQMTYLLSLTEQNPKLSSILLSPSNDDLDSILHNLSPSSEDFFSFFNHIEVKQVKTRPYTSLPLDILSKNSTYRAHAWIQKEKILHILLSSDKNSLVPSNAYNEGIIIWKDGSFHFETNGKQYPLNVSSFQLPSPLFLSIKKKDKPSYDLEKDENITLAVEGRIQEQPLKMRLPLSCLQIHEAIPIECHDFSQLFWTISKDDRVILPQRYFPDHTPVLLPKSLQDNGARIGDKGILSYATTTMISPKEQRLSIIVSGFYDPGILPIGNKFLIVPSYITQTINASSPLLLPDGSPSNGIYVWFSDHTKAKKIKAQIIEALEKVNLASFWNVHSYQEYEFSKDLFDQFQSDRLLFTMIAVIILIVACSNIISLLVLLVNDKKKEIAILQAMGATKGSIALIFGLSGIIMGLISSVIGSLLAILTLRHIDLLAQFLSIIQGHTAFNPSFFGKVLPNELSFSALLFILIATPLIALISGLIPAIRATRLSPSNILRSSE